MPAPPATIREVLQAAGALPEEGGRAAPLPTPPPPAAVQPPPNIWTTHGPGGVPHQAPARRIPIAAPPGPVLPAGPVPVTAEGPVLVAEAIPPPPLPPLAFMGLGQAVLDFFAVLGPWALSFGVFLIFANAYVNYGEWTRLLLGWTTCFLALGIAYYLLGALGFSDPRAPAKPLWVGGALALLGFLATTGPMRTQGLYNEPWLVLVNNSFLIATTGALGLAVARGIQQSGHLIAVALVGLVVDLWSVYQGPSRQVADAAIDAIQRGVYTGEVAPPLVSFFLLRFPTPGRTDIQAMLGAGDLVFLAFFFGCVARFGLAPVRNYLGLVGITVGAVALASFLAEWNIQGIPALPILAPFFVLLNLRRLRMGPRDWRVTGVFVAGLLALMVVVTLLRALTL